MCAKYRTLTQTQLSILSFVEENNGEVTVSQDFEFNGEKLRCDLLLRLNSWGLVKCSLSHKGYNCSLTDSGRAHLERARKPRHPKEEPRIRKRTLVSAMPFTYAISASQPWASAIIIGQKPVENRLWAMPERFVGVPVFLHAALAFPRKGKWPEELFRKAMDIDIAGQFGGILGWVVFGKSVTDFHSPWAVPGYWHWPVLQAQRLDFFPCKGKARFFRIFDHPSRNKLIETVLRADNKNTKPPSKSIPLLRVSPDGESPILPLPSRPANRKKSFWQT